MSQRGLQQLLVAGRAGWAIIGVTGALVVVGFIFGRLSLVIVPVVLALFPATLLVPLASRLKRRLPDALAASITLVAGLAAIGMVVGLMVPLVVAELPRLADTAGEGVAEVGRFLDEGPFGLDLGGAAGLVDRAREQLGDLGGLAGPALGVATAAFEIIVATVLLLVVLFFYLKDGDRIGRGLLAVVPPRQQPRLRRIGEQAWETLGAFFRGQLLIALVDAAAIGIGLALLRVPLALPLAVLIFFGGLFPIVGAVTAGALAVLVALAHGGVGLGLLVLALIVAVQQLEGNVLEPLILSQVVKLHALLVVLAVTAGAIAFGVLGAFLAVPGTAVAGHVVRILREDRGMEQRLSLITLGVSDLQRARAFYEQLGWRGQEVDETVFFQAGGLAVVLWSREKLALDARVTDRDPDGFGGITLACNVRSRAEVDDIVATAQQAGATVTRPPEDTFYGGYAGCFADPDGHIWEIAYNPGFPLAADGSITVPDFSNVRSQ